ncbi:glycosyltransferase family 8 protein [bacterium]|nr:glycosyltransferase family 8 protein [bacterium]
MKINIVFTITEDWTFFNLVTIMTILKKANPADEYHFYIISSSLSDENKNKFLKLNRFRNAQYHFLHVDNDEFTPFTNNTLGNVANYRLKIPELIKEKKVLFLDVDIVVRYDIAELYSYDISDCYFAGVEDKQYEMRERINLPYDQQYTNGGVLLMNLDKLRKDNFYEFSKKMLSERTFLNDQDAVNEFSGKKLLGLPLKYNVMFAGKTKYLNRREEYEQALQDPVIIHLSASKPWEIMPQLCPVEWKTAENEVRNLLND